MSLEAQDVPASNPWAQPPKPATAAPPPPPPEEGEAPQGQDPDDNADTDSAPADAKAPPVAAAHEKNVRRSTCCACCARCARSVHKTLATSPSLTAIYVGIMTAACFGLFVYSIYLLQPMASAGSCDASTSCASFPVVKSNLKCVAAVAAGNSCADVCRALVLASSVPFRFRIPSVSAVTDWVSCPFPLANSNWRIPLTLFLTLLCTTALIMLACGCITKWKAYALGAVSAAGPCALGGGTARQQERPLLIFRFLQIDLLVLVGGGVYFYTMVIDAVRAPQRGRGYTPPSP
jgi:hypothetical protein